MKPFSHSILFASILSMIIMMPVAKAGRTVGTDFVSSYVTATYNRSGLPWHEIASGSTPDSNSITLIEGGEINYGNAVAPYTINAWAQTDYGYNRAETNLAATGLNFTSIWVDAYSTYQSIWTINPPANAQVGDWGSARIGVTLNGATDGYQDNTNLTAYFDYILECDDGACAETTWDRYDDYHAIHVSTNRLPENQQRGAISGAYYGELGFIYGEPFEVKSKLQSHVSVNGFYNEGYAGWGSSDFGNTAALTFLELPQGAVLTTGTGTGFPVSYVPQVPVPASGILMSSGLFSLILARRRKRMKPR